MKHALYAAATALAVIVAALWFSAGTASAAPPIVCVRNLAGGDLDVVAGVQADRPERPGVYLGKAKAHGGSCWYADIDGDMNVFFWRGAPVSRLGEQYSVISTAGGAWRECPAQTSANGWYIYTVRSARSVLACRVGGGAAGLEGPGDYE